jgi:hypothetical protein
MGFMEGGGFVLTTDEGSFVYQVPVDEKKLREIAKLLHMPEMVAKEVPKARSIHVFRGRFVPSSGGSGGGGSSGG